MLYSPIFNNIHFPGGGKQMDVRNVKRFGGILFIRVVKLHLLNEVCISAFFVFLFLDLAFCLREHSSTSSRVIGGSVEKPSGTNSRSRVYWRRSTQRFVITEKDPTYYYKGRVAKRHWAIPTHQSLINFVSGLSASLFHVYFPWVNACLA